MVPDGRRQVNPDDGAAGVNSYQDARDREQDDAWPQAKASLMVPGTSESRAGDAVIVTSTVWGSFETFL